MKTLDPLAPDPRSSPPASRHERERFPALSSDFCGWRARWKQRMLLHVSAPLRAFGTRLEQAAGILTYHRVAAAQGTDRGMLSVTPRRFEMQIEGLLRLGYEPWSLRKVIAHHGRGEEIPRKAFVVVFDDGYENVYLNAWPVLRRYKVPATVFLATAYLDQNHPFPFDGCWRDSNGAGAPEAFCPLKTAQCKEMLASGLVDLGSHTHTHVDFRHRPEPFRRDLQASLDLLRERFGIAEATFSFPYGFTGPELTRVLKKAGTLCGLTADSRLITPRSDPYHWGRFGATEFDTAGTLAAKLDGWYCFAREVWRSARNG